MAKQNYESITAPDPAIDAFVSMMNAVATGKPVDPTEFKTATPVTAAIQNAMDKSRNIIVTTTRKTDKNKR